MKNQKIQQTTIFGIKAKKKNVKTQLKIYICKLFFSFIIFAMKLAFFCSTSADLNYVCIILQLKKKFKGLLDSKICYLIGKTLKYW